MSLIAVFQEAATVIGMDVPTAVYGSPAREHQELGVVANTLGRRIARAYEWQELKRYATLTGDGVATDFALPADYDRMPKKGSLWSDTIPGFTHVTDYDKWLEWITRSGVSSVTATSGGAFDAGFDKSFDIGTVISPMVGNCWTLLGGRIHVMPALVDGQTATYAYQSKLYARAAAGDKERFNHDADEFVLSEELLRLGIIWQWKANKGFAYAEDMTNYEDLLSTLVAADIGPRSIRIGTPRMPTDATYAYPGVVVA